MKKILITGANSYIGSSFEKWVAQWPDKYIVDTVDMIDGSWKGKDFSGYDVVFHVAGIVHIKETKRNQKLYYKVNRDLAYETAQKAKLEKVSQFIFLSTMSVYGIESGVITRNSSPNPKSAYGKSKFEAEELLKEMTDDNFKIVILRAPIVYGKGCKGNYSRLAGLALRLPLFPEVKNQRSMIFVDNLSKSVRLIIDNELTGLYFPQNGEYVNISELVSLIAEIHGKKLKMTKKLNIFLSLCIRCSETFGKVFGSLVYDKKMTNGFAMLDYEPCSFQESIKLTEK